ncbi:MAG: hypothetical protein WKF87_10005 [Chryseolinea sp.]
MKHAIILTALFVTSFQCLSQELIGSIGISAQAMRELKELQAFNVNQGPATLKNTQSFPPFLQYQLGMRFILSERVKLGGILYLTSTAARSAISDYTGSITVDQKLGCVGTGAYFAYVVTHANRWKISLYAISGVEFSSLNLSVHVNIPSVEVSKRQSKFGAVSAMAEGGLEFQRAVTDRLSLHLNIGAHLSPPTDLINDDNERFGRVNWTGAKIMGGLCYKLKND